MSQTSKEIDNTVLLMQILGDVQNRSYIELVKSVEKKIKNAISDSEIQEGEAPITHHFAPNIYMRQMDAVAGTLVVSKMHRTEHLNILLKGSLTVVTEEGIQHLTAPMVIKSMPGTKRIGYFHEDTSWITIHPTKLTNVEEIEREVIVPEEEVDAFLESIGYQTKEFKLWHGQQ
ncbi:hypothetical protein P255_01422 [Acinetobacter brisouii CIP 110357]|uniref:Uncharacterized protein n=1 Tax=Acinetobacter brisouii CIP 110357 TaxID=1341683 RepID=V2U945_9GAMM|nr:hypothetical protein [Acinetobacter brisouii]ENV46052.1 hypothetical protein F954_02878 [Acinetobacter brisouii ANC 4119]ESK50923.1 hypothetical protein P255_01422 [Acinetobacter brisouii CIP 110357]